MTRRRCPLLAAALAALVLGGCGVGAGDSADGVRITVTRDFGARTVLEADRPRTGGGDTVMRLLQRNARVQTRYGGGFVQAINGLAGGHEDGRRVDWFYFVNGVEADEGAAEVDVEPGDRIWWDRRDWEVTSDIPAVIGSFPEPFLHGVGGRRLPVRVECGEPGGDLCQRVADALVALDIPAAQAGVATSAGAETLRVLVGPWTRIARDAGVRQLEGGPEDSGVFARMAEDGRSLTSLDVRGRDVRRLGPGTGLIAASTTGDQRPFWVVTGTDAAGVAAAVRAFEAGESALADTFALAIVGDRGVPLPEAPR